jgi:hypothetical protein
MRRAAFAIGLVLVGCGPIGDKGRGSGAQATDGAVACDPPPVGCEGPPVFFPPAPSVSLQLDAASAPPRPANDAASDAADESEASDADATDSSTSDGADAGGG